MSFLLKSNHDRSPSRENYEWDWSEMLKILLLALCGSIHASHIPALRVDISRTECQKNERKKADYFAVFAFVLVVMYVVARLNFNYTVKRLIILFWCYLAGQSHFPGSKER